MILILLFTSCAHHYAVKKGKNNRHRISKTGDSAGKAYDRAYKQALHFCDSSKKKVKILKKVEKYTGNVSEAEYRRQVDYSKTAMIAGGAASVVGSAIGANTLKTAGNVAGGLGFLVNATTKDAYTINMTFACL
ncbi:hypothetical protein N9N67_11360 [Bacteriovoracaceae bacterium]|nr:hypothetical protein [Bacteriovoracaceae bacterium]